MIRRKSRPISASAKHEERIFYLFILPWLIGLVVFSAGPVFGMLGLSFTDWRISLDDLQFIGLDNYAKLFDDPIFWTSVGNTLYIVVGRVVFGVSFALLLAVLLNQKVPGIAFFRAVYYLPTVTAGVAVALVWIWIFNPRLGILDGISILGTTGVVQPFSTAAWRASVNVSIDVAAANSLPHMVITTGTQSENFAKRWLGLEDMAYVNVGIFTGAALKRCVQRGIPRATLVGMVGKFSKIAMGYFVTHVAGNKVDPVFLASLAAECGASEEVQAEMREAASGRHFQEIALERGMMPVFDLMCARVCDAAQAYLSDRADDLVVDAICFDFEGGILGKATTGAYIDIQERQDG